MDGRMFTLVNEKNENQVFAWGIEIYDGTSIEAVIFRRGRARRAMFGVHPSAEAARSRFSQLYAPMVLNWEDEFLDEPDPSDEPLELSEPTQPDDPAEAAEPGHSRP